MTPADLRRLTLRRAAGIAAAAVIAGVVVALPMIIDHGMTNPGIPRGRLLIGVISGVTLIPLALVSLARKRLLTSALVLPLPALAAAIGGAAWRNADMAFFLVGMPTLAFTTLLVLAIGPERTTAHVGRCVCGYDLRDAATLRCPECGLDRTRPTPPPRLWLRLLLWAAVLPVSGAAYVLFARGMMSLG